MNISVSLCCGNISPAVSLFLTRRFTGRRKKENEETPGGRGRSGAEVEEKNGAGGADYDGGSGGCGGGDGGAIGSVSNYRGPRY